MKKIHFVGIGGIGMSALAQYFNDREILITGSDRSGSPVTDLLEKKGIKIIFEQKAENVSEDVDAIVYSDAVSENNPERVRAKELGVRQYSYFEMLGEVSKNMDTIAIAGTHGKTTTTGMLTKILCDADINPTAIIGSLVKDFGSNYVAGSPNLLVVEACEYRDHLLELSPRVLVINNLEWDHTDWFPSLQAVQETFKKAIERVPKDGIIITNPNDANILPILSAAKARIVDYTKEPSCQLLLPGEFNQMNARAAAAAARVVVSSVSDSLIIESLLSFQGTWRRFEYKGKTKNGADVYDDYAHHPTAVRETLRALRAQTAGKIFVAFHPHLYSRTRDLFDDFAESFGDAVKVIIAPIYAAREINDGHISNEMLAERICANGTEAVALNSFDEIKKVLDEVGSDDVIMTMGAGDIYKVADALVAQD